MLLGRAGTKGEEKKSTKEMCPNAISLPKEKSENLPTLQKVSTTTPLKAPMAQAKRGAKSEPIPMSS